MTRLKIRVPRPWPRLPDGEYRGVIVRGEAGLDTWGRRRKRDGSQVRDAHVYLHVRLTHGAGPAQQAALTRYAQTFGEPPVCFYPARYEVGLHDETPRMLGRSSMLFGLLRILQAPPTADEFDLLEFLGSRVDWTVRVRLYCSPNSRDRDAANRPLPKAEAERFSKVHRVLDAAPPGSTPINDQGSGITDQGSTITHQPPPAPVVSEGNRKNEPTRTRPTTRTTPGTTPDQGFMAGAAVARYDPGHHPTALAGSAPPGSSPARADGTLAPSDIVRQAVALFNGEIVATRRPGDAPSGPGPEPGR